jgi:lysozyme
MSAPINVVIDLSHHQETVDFDKLQDEGIVGVIHKATEGLSFADKTYAERRDEARQRGLMWGAYHFGVGADGSDQSDFFIRTAKLDEQTLMVLDYEPNVTGPTMTLNQAREFVEHVEEITGRYPGLYSGHLIKEQLAGVTLPDPVLSNCFLWIAQYNGPKPLNIPPTFKTWTLWQYTDGVHGPEPHRVEGVGQCDRNRFNGSLAQLKKLWGVPQKGKD